MSRQNKPYVEWDESITIPSRKERRPLNASNRSTRTQANPKQPNLRISKVSKHPIASIVHDRPYIRKRRVRYVRWMRFYVLLRRIGIRFVLGILVLLTFFWGKFVYVYDLPPYIQQQYPQVIGYIAWKNWWFGPPVMDLRDYGNPITEQNMVSFDIGLNQYSDIVHHPFIIWENSTVHTHAH